MPLSMHKGSGSQSSVKGAFVGEVSIISAEDISHQKLPYMDRECEIGIRLKLDIGREFTPEMNITGEFKKDAAGRVEGWGSAFRIRDFLLRMGYEGQLNTDNSIPKEVFDILPGKKFLRLSYVSGTKKNGKKRYSDWAEIATLEEGASSLEKRFAESVAKGFPRNYRPELAESKEDTSFNPVDL